MKLKVSEFEDYAMDQGYESGVDLFEELGYTEEEYEEYANGKAIDRAMLLALYRSLGASDVVNFIEFEQYEWENNLDLFDKI